MAKTIVLALGAVFLLVGILGFILPNPLFGIFEVDTVHNVIHLATGLLALYFGMKGESGAKLFAKIFGVIYAVVTVVGFIQGDTVLGIIHTNMADHVLHLLVAVVLLYIGFGGEKDNMMMS